MDKVAEIERARDLRRQDELEQSQEVLLNLLSHFPKDPLVLYEVGGSFDVLGEELKAIPYYEQAIQQGLIDDDLQECMVCLGSSYRAVGQFSAAVTILEKAVKQYPDNYSGHVFLALAYYSDGQEDEAVRLLLDLLLKTTKDENILQYADPLDFYKDHLDEVWHD